MSGGRTTRFLNPNNRPLRDQNGFETSDVTRSGDLRCTCVSRFCHNHGQGQKCLTPIQNELLYEGHRLENTLCEECEQNLEHHRSAPSDQW